VSRAHLFLIRNRPEDAFSGASSLPPHAALICRNRPFLASAPSYAERLMAAHRIAAEVRARKPEMQVKRGPVTGSKRAPACTKTRQWRASRHAPALMFSASSGASCDCGPGPINSHAMVTFDT
jgi:hypothetical protein